MDTCTDTYMTTRSHPNAGVARSVSVRVVLEVTTSAGAVLGPYVSSGLLPT